ncbi:MAG: PDR/VanB family oxidoreductase [Betaproteobacteria bacterium]
MSLATLILRVTAVEDLAHNIRSFELRHPEGQDLPAFSAGAHIRVKTPSGAVRAYSLCNDPSETHRYLIAVQREGRGRGGSLSLVDGVKAGDLIEVRTPQNQFSLDERAKEFLLIAGGIGITPLLAMARQLESQGRRYRLIYLTREAQNTAFREILSQAPFDARVRMHHDGGDPARALDLWPLLEKPGSLQSLQVYCCGPAGLMDAVRDMTGHWPASAVHFESFGADTGPHDEDQPFEVQLQGSGEVLEVPVGSSILQTLRNHGIAVPFSCESGTCGSCKTGLIEGEPDHRDLVLLEEEKSNRIMVCVSRAHGGRLVLDL